MRLGEIAFCGLNRRRNLNGIDISRFHFGLHQEIPDAIKNFGDKTQNTNFRLFDDGLIPFRNKAKIGFNSNAFY